MSEPAEPLRLFLCHSSGDKPAVRELCRKLHDDGFAPWLDEQQLLPGQDWNEEIRQALHQSQVVVICLSRASVTKEGYLQKEIKYALDVMDEKPEGTIFLIPLKLEECEIPHRLSRWQWASLLEPDGYRRLLLALQHRAASIGPAASASQPIPRLRSTKATLSANQAKVIVATHNFYCAGWNQGGKGIAHRYETVVLGDALLVADHATGLLWQKDASPQPVSRLDGAETYVHQLNLDRYAGFDDWRLPTLEEGMSLMTTAAGGVPDEVLLGSESRKGVMHLDPVFEISAAPFIWTADAASGDRGWVIYFWDGMCSTEVFAFNAYVRAVRSDVGT